MFTINYYKRTILNLEFRMQLFKHGGKIKTFLGKHKEWQSNAATCIKNIKENSSVWRKMTVYKICIYMKDSKTVKVIVI